MVVEEEEGDEEGEGPPNREGAKKTDPYGDGLPFPLMEGKTNFSGPSRDPPAIHPSRNHGKEVLKCNY